MLKEFGISGCNGYLKGFSGIQDTGKKIAKTFFDEILSKTNQEGRPLNHNETEIKFLYLNKVYTQVGLENIANFFDEHIINTLLT
jgi:hypothetical protein